MGAKSQSPRDTQTFQHMGQPQRVESTQWGAGGDQSSSGAAGAHKSLSLSRDAASLHSFLKLCFLNET